MQHTLTGAFRHHHSFPSRALKNARDIIVYLPPGYEESPDTRYPVLYMHDGQNLFDAATAFLGNEWGLDEAAEDMIARGEIQPLLIVGIYNTGLGRMAEYTPVQDRRGRGGKARAYGTFIVQELKPFIDAEYRTLPGAENTGLGGSSLGALVTVYLGLKYRKLFGKLIVMSPSVWWAGRAILKEVARLRQKTPQKIWLDIGTQEDSRPEFSVRDASALRDAFVAKGWRLGEDLSFHIDEGAGHNERAWGFRMRAALPFLFGAAAAP